jgi:dihydrolipoamide dehydrogenase
MAHPAGGRVDDLVHLHGGALIASLVIPAGENYIRFPQQRLHQMPDTSFDIIIIGSGPGGYVTAIRAAQLGFKVAVVERDFLGGICTNWGCIPTKALLRSADVFHLMTHAKEYGLSAKDVSFDPAAVIKRSRGVAGRMSNGVGFLFKKNKIQLIWGEAVVDAPGKITVKQSKAEAPKGALPPGGYQAKHIIIATGARPRVFPGIEPDKKLVWTYFEAMNPDKMPKSLLVIGSGAIGVEFASFYRTLGAEVTIVEVLPQILPVEDAEIAGFARKQFERQGIKIITAAKVTKLEKKTDSVTATIEDGKGGTQITADRVISGVGVVGNIENLGLERLGVKTERGTILVDGYCKTNVPGIYAIGDVAGPPMLAHKAEHEGIICVEAIKGMHPHPMDRNLIPGCTYCNPQVASVGLTEAKAKESKREVRIGKFPFVGNGKAIALGEDQGLVKVIFDKKTGALIGAHMVGAEVTELIQGYVVAMNLETTEEELMHTIFPHPTISETMKEAVLDAYGRVLNM